MSKHDRKEPPLLKVVKHIKANKTRITHNLSLAFLILVFAMTFAGVTL